MFILRPPPPASHITHGHTSFARPDPAILSGVHPGYGPVRESRFEPTSLRSKVAEHPVCVFGEKIQDGVYGWRGDDVGVGWRGGHPSLGRLRSGIWSYCNNCSRKQLAQNWRSFFYCFKRYVFANYAILETDETTPNHVLFRRVKFMAESGVMQRRVLLY